MVLKIQPVGCHEEEGSWLASGLLLLCFGLLNSLEDLACGHLDFRMVKMYSLVAGAAVEKSCLKG